MNNAIYRQRIAVEGVHSGHRHHEHLTGCVHAQCCPDAGMRGWEAPAVLSCRVGGIFAVQRCI